MNFNNMIGVFISYPTAPQLNLPIDTLQPPLVKNPGIINNSRRDNKEPFLLNSLENMVFLQRKCGNSAKEEAWEETQKSKVS